MSRLTWGALTERFFETGVDRGVLYVGVSAGVPWNGLVSVSESPTGGEPKPAYIDGYKFRNVASSEEFEATLEAYAAPKEFAPCDGSVSIQNGLIATQQPRRAFGLSYRTKIGNAVDGADHAYKIHLVYNALAAPAQRTNTTLSDSQGLNALSWSLTTLPPSLTGYKPTAHWIIDSRTTPRGLLVAIEDMLYGTDAAAARMPLVSELVELFKSAGPVVRTNLMINPAYRSTSGTAEIRRNFCLDPNVVSPVGWSGVSAGGGMTQAAPYTHNVTSAVNVTWTASADITAPSGTTLTGFLSAGFTTAASFGTNGRTTTAFSIPAGTTRRISNTNVVPVGADGLRLLVSGLNVIDGTALITKVLIEKANAPLPYFHGGLSPLAELTAAWTGTVNASESTLSGVGTYTNSFKGYLRPAWKGLAAATDGSDTTRSYIGAATSTLLLFSSDTPPVIVGDAVSGRFRVRLMPGLSDAPITITPSLFAYTAGGAGLGTIMTGPLVTVPIDGSWMDVVVPMSIITLATTAQACLYVTMTTSPVGLLGIVEVSNALVEPGVLGPYFDGSTLDFDGDTYDWTGTPDASTSTLKNWK